MKPPNQLTPVHLAEDHPGLAQWDLDKWPLLKLSWAEKDGSEAAGLAFVDELHGVTRPIERDRSTPPTWMDPEIFVRLALMRPHLAGLAKAGAKQGRPQLSEERIRRELKGSLEEDYLPYLRAQFARALPFLAEWVAEHIEGCWEQQEVTKHQQRRQGQPAPERQDGPAGPAPRKRKRRRRR